MQILEHDKYTVLMPETPARIYTNCSGQLGKFLTSEKIPLDRKMEGVIVHHEERQLTFGEEYVNEDFVEIWMIPTRGVVKGEMPKEASLLLYLLMHRKSRRLFLGWKDKVEIEAYSAFIKDKRKKPIESYKAEADLNFYTKYIYTLEMKEATSKPDQSNKTFQYFYVETSRRSPEAPHEEGMLAIGAQIREMIDKGENPCVDTFIIENELKSLQAQEQKKALAGERMKKVAMPAIEESRLELEAIEIEAKEAF